jgi:hypothetical protein
MGSSKVETHTKIAIPVRQQQRWIDYAGNIHDGGFILDDDWTIYWNYLLCQ